MTTTETAGTQDELRRNNLARLLRLLHVEGATSRSRLTALTGLNRSTVRALTTELVNAGLLRESAPVAGGAAGRPSIVVEPESIRTYVLAIDLGVEHLVAARIGLGGAILDRRETRRLPAARGVGETLRRLAALLEAMRAAAPPTSRCIGVGLGIAGVAGRTDGVVRFAPNLGWVDVPLAELLSERLGWDLPILVGNDGDLGARAEHLRGAAAGFSDVIYVSGEVGVGGGIIVDGRPLHGAAGYAGEIGHMCVNPGRGRHCRCGRRGCWETEIGEEAVLLAIGAPAGTELADVLAAGAAGDKRTVAGLRRVAGWLGLGVANLVNVFNPEMVVFGGTTRGVFEATREHVRAALGDALAAPRGLVRLEPAALGLDSTVIGAGELAFAPLLADPQATMGLRMQLDA